MIIHHLQSKHKFHQRPGSPLHLPNEEPVLGYLKFSAKGTKQEVFGMLIPNDLITTDIRGEQYYNAYLDKVAKHKRYLAGEEVSDPDSLAPKPAKATKPKATKQSKPLASKAAPVTKPVAAKTPKLTASQPPKPTPATTELSKKDQSKKRKLFKESSEAPSPAKRPIAGKVIKKRKPKSSLQLVDEIVDEGVPDKEPVYNDEEADTQRAIEESLKEVHDAHRGLLPPVEIREPDSGKFQPLPYVQGKGKEKVSDEQVALDLLTLQTPKKKSPGKQYIFQRRSSAPTEPSGHDESSSLYAELGLTDSETESDEEMPGTDAGDHDEGQAGPNPGIQAEGQAGSNPGDAAVSQPQSSHAVHAGPNRKHMDLKVTDTSIQQNPEQMDEEFTTTAYLNVQENLKLPTEDQFFVETSHEDEPDKTNTESEVQSMVTIPIHQDTSSVPLMTTPVVDLTVSQPVSTTVQAPLPTSIAMVTAITTTTSLLPPPTQPQQGSSDSILIQCIGELEQHMADLLQDNIALEERLDKHGSRLYKLENPDIPHQVSKAVDEIVMDVVDWAIQAPLRDRFRYFPEADMKEILHHRMWETKSYEAHEDHKKLNNKKSHESPKTPPRSPLHQPPPPPLPAGPFRTSGASRSSQLPPPPPPPSTNQSNQSKSTAAPSSSKTATSAEYTAWTTTDTRLKPSVSSIPEDLHMDADSAPEEQVHSYDDEYIGNAHIPKSSALASTYAPPLENSLLSQTGDMAIFMDWFCKKQGITELTQKDLEGPEFKIVKVFHPNVIHLQYQIKEFHKLLTDQVDDAIIRHNVSKPLPLGWQTCVVNLEDESGVLSMHILRGSEWCMMAIVEILKTDPWVSNSLVYSLRALSTLRCFGLRTASTAAKPGQGDSSEFYLITGRILTVVAAGKRHIDS
ncbi:hypothetical protein Tco_1204073 [Tanacetum coccineum]